MYREVSFGFQLRYEFGQQATSGQSMPDPVYTDYYYCSYHSYYYYPLLLLQLASTIDETMSSADFS